MALKPFEVKEGVQVVRKAAQGATAIVYQAIAVTDLPYAQKGTPLAVKLYRSSLTDAARRRIAKEIEIGRRLSSRFCVKYYEQGVYSTSLDDHTFVIMEWVQGLPLANVVKTLKGATHLERKHHLRRTLLDLIGALEAIHRAGLVHRDLQPKNIMITPQGNAKLLDYGSARFINQATETAVWEEIGSRRYWPPEALSQFTTRFGEKVDRRTLWESDLFMLASCLIHAYTSKYLFHDANTYPAFYKALERYGQGGSDWPRELDLLIPLQAPVLFGVFTKMLAPVVEGRLSAADLIALLNGKFDRLVGRRLSYDRFPLSWLTWLLPKGQDWSSFLKVLQAARSVPRTSWTDTNSLFMQCEDLSMPDFGTAVELLVAFGALRASRRDEPVCVYSPEDFDPPEWRYELNERIQVAATPVLAALADMHEALLAAWRDCQAAKQCFDDPSGAHSYYKGRFGRHHHLYKVRGRIFVLPDLEPRRREYLLCVASGWLSPVYVPSLKWEPAPFMYDKLGRY